MIIISSFLCISIPYFIYNFEVEEEQTTTACILGKSFIMSWYLSWYHINYNVKQKHIYYGKSGRPLLIG